MTISKELLNLPLNVYGTGIEWSTHIFKSSPVAIIEQFLVQFDKTLEQQSTAAPTVSRFFGNNTIRNTL